MSKMQSYLRCMPTGTVVTPKMMQTNKEFNKQLDKVHMEEFVLSGKLAQK